MAEPIYYQRERDAFDRVELLKQCGIWPAVLTVRMFGTIAGYRLTYDPQIPVSEMTRYGVTKSGMAFL